jgi:thioesterase domain-containing protein
MKPLGLIDREPDDRNTWSQPKMIATEWPAIFFMPPAAGEEPAQTRFLATFGEAVRFIVVEYPSLAEMIKSHGRFDIIVDAVVTQITQVRANGPYLLAGYSFGGFVAREVARRLIEAGHDVNFLGLIDTRLELRFSTEGAHAKAIRFIGKLWTQPKEAAFRARIWALEHLPFVIARLLSRLQSILPVKYASAFEMELAARLRMKSLYETTVTPLSVKTTLFQSEQLFGEKPDVEWDAISSDLVAIFVRGSHTSLFDPPNCLDLRDRMLEAVNSSCFDHSSTETGNRTKNR